MSSPTDTQQLQPQNYLAAEMLGQKAQDAQEAEFYRGRAQEAQTTAQMAQQQMEELQSQLQQLQMQADQAGQQIQQATQGAMAAQDEALKQTQVAANMRMGMQKLRAQMLEVASQDPAEVAAQELQAQAAPPEPVPQEGGPPMTQEAGKEVEQAQRAQDEAAQQTSQAEQKAGEEAAQAAPTAAPPGGGFPPGQAPGQMAAAPSGGADMSTMEPAAGMKMGHVKTAGPVLNQLKQRLPWALAGAGLGVAHHYSLAGSAPELRSKVEELQADTQGGFFHAMRLAARKQQLADAQVAENYPGHSMGTQAARGALVGALAGPLVGSNVRAISQHVKDL